MAYRVNSLATRLRDWTEPLTRDSRYWRAGLTSLTSAGTAAVQMLVTLLTTPMLLGYLGPVRFGAWATLYSLVVMLNSLDFGIGLGLLNALTDCYGRGDWLGARRYISSAL